MTLRPAAEADLPGLGAFLRPRVEGSMFLLANLRDYGLGGTAPNALTLWLQDGPDGPRGALGITNGGMVLVQMPDAGAADWRAAAARIGSRPCTGLFGPADQARFLLDALGLTGAPTRLDADEAGFTLPLEGLILPDVPGTDLRPAGAADRPLLTDWRIAYHTEVLGTAAAEAPALAARDVAGWIAAGSHRLLWQDGAPVALTGFNARLDDVVQVGGVFVPPALRGRKLAQRAVALHLAEARTEGATRAVLFAVSDTAAGAYRAIGFTPCGAVSLILFDTEGVKA